MQEDSGLPLIPPELTTTSALGLIVLSYFTSALTACVGVGGGIALIRCLEVLSELNGVTEGENFGIDIVRQAVKAPLLQICANAGVSGQVVAHHVTESKKPEYGYNARTDEYGDMYKYGIIDPTKVTRIALENAASVGSMMLMTECVVTDIKSDDDNTMGGMPGMM